MSEYVGPFDKILHRVSAFEANTDHHIIQVARRFERKIIELNTEFQLYDEGALSDGRFLPDYTAHSKELKAMVGQKYSNMTLSNTWDFYENFYIEWGADEFRIWSRSENTAKIFKYLKKKKYAKPELVFGLTEQNLAFMTREHFLPALQQRFASFLFA